MEDENEVVTEKKPNKFEYEPLMFWKDITDLLQKIGKFFKSLFGIQ